MTGASHVVEVAQPEPRAITLTKSTNARAE
jgi:hypothetical protein